MFCLLRSIFPIDTPIWMFDWMFLLNVYLAPLLGGKHLRSSKERPIIGRKTCKPYFRLLINQSKPLFHMTCMFSPHQRNFNCREVDTKSFLYQRTWVHCHFRRVIARLLVLYSIFNLLCCFFTMARFVRFLTSEYLSLFFECSKLEHSLFEWTQSRCFVYLTSSSWNLCTDNFRNK